MEENKEQSPTHSEEPAAPELALPKKPANKSKKLILVALGFLLIAAGAAAYLLTQNDEKKTEDTSTNQQKPADKPEETSQLAAISCENNERPFADEGMGMAFCYPNEWGDTTITDAKLDESDTGHRQSVTFSEKPEVVVGGVSDDWSTTVGRDGNCMLLGNEVAELSDHNTEWHDIEGEGMAVSFASRSLEVSEGGYQLSEYVTDMLESGVCLAGRKEIDGPRYRVAALAYFTGFSDEIASPKAHMDNPNELVSAAGRSALDAVMASLIAYEPE